MDAAVLGDRRRERAVGECLAIDEDRDVTAQPAVFVQDVGAEPGGGGERGVEGSADGRRRHALRLAGHVGLESLGEVDFGHASRSGGWAAQDSAGVHGRLDRVWLSPQNPRPFSPSAAIP